ncbi:protein-L-isoaspartate O-methyltransferase family protein [Streptomyces sp. SGAir0957]
MPSTEKRSLPRFWGYDTDAEGLHLVIDRDADEEGWRRAVWGTHRSLIMQIDDSVLPEHGPAKGVFTSSISALDIVFEKLNRLDVESGQRMPHIGTASGYDSALLCEAVGSNNVTTIEYDRAMAARGAANPEAAGYTPTASRGDGLGGWVHNAPYDRIIATAAVRGIPEAWRDQAAERAIILAPHNTLFRTGGLLQLTVRGGAVTGRFVGGACYMWVRSHRPHNQLSPPDDGRKVASVIAPYEVFADGWDQRFVLGLHLPDVAFSHRGRDEERQVQLRDEAGTSVAIVNYSQWWRPGAVTLNGARDL